MIIGPTWLLTNYVNGRNCRIRRSLRSTRALRSLAARNRPSSLPATTEVAGPSPDAAHDTITSVPRDGNQKSIGGGGRNCPSHPTSAADAAADTATSAPHRGGPNEARGTTQDEQVLSFLICIDR